MTTARALWRGAAGSYLERGIALVAPLICAIPTPAYADFATPAWQIVQGPAPATAKTLLCAHADTSDKSGSARQPWQVSIGARDACSERFLVDLSRRQIFFDFVPSFSWPAAGAGNDVRISCTGVDASEYTPCASRLFDKKGSNRRVLRRDAVTALFDGNGGQSLLDDAREERERATIGAIQARYKKEFAEATTLEKIIAFEQEWGLFDLNKLVPKLQPLKRRLLHERYLASFRDARTKADLSRFIETYGNDDPDRLVPQARQKLAAAQAVDQARERAALEKQAAAQRVQAQAAKRKEAQARVANCKRMTVMAYATLERERSIAAVSGVENLAVKRQAGEIIVACQQVIGRGY